MGIKSNLLVQATKYNSKRAVEFALSLDSFARRNEPSYSRENNQHLNSALMVAIENLNFDIVELLVNAGADVNSLDKDNKNAIMHAVERISTSKGLSVDPSRNLPEEIISHPIVQFLLMKGSKYYSIDNADTEEGRASSIRGSVGQSSGGEYIHQEPVVGDEQIYEEMDHFSRELTRDDVQIYQESARGNEPAYVELIWDDESGDEEPISRYGYLRFITHHALIHQEPIRDDESIHEEPIRCDQHIHQNPTYHTEDLAEKRSERKAKFIKASSGIYRGLVEARKNQWEEKISKCKSEANTATGLKEELQANTRKASGANVERITQEKCRLDYDFDLKVEQSKKPESHNSEANAVYIEYGARVIGGCRRKITDISLYVSPEECRMQIKPIDSSRQEHTKISTDLATKKSGSKAKSTKASFGVYRGLVKDRKNQWEEKISKCKLGADTITGRKEEIKANAGKLQVLM